MRLRYFKRYNQIYLIRKNISSYIATHEVVNQSKPLIDIDIYESDPGLRDSMKAFLGNDSNIVLGNYGKLIGSESMMRCAELAERNRPVLRQFDNYGRRIDVVDYHDSYHTLMKTGLGNGAAAYGFRNSLTEASSQVTRGALIYMQNQLDAGHCCPIVMTAAAIPVIERHIDSNDAVVGSNGIDLKEYLQKLLSQDYDPRNVPVSEKKGITIGMSMTEKQGGSDVRSNRTTAEPLSDSSADSGIYKLTGHKWFTSAPMCDAFLTLAQIPGTQAPSCFLVPRWLPNGKRNTGFQVMRLKNKLGDGSNASSEVEYRGAWAQLIGEPGRGVKTIIEMVQSTRLDCALGSAGGARRALQLALNHTMGRNAFGSRLIDHSLMQNVLADLCIESEAQTLTALYMAHCFGRYYHSNQPSNDSSKLHADVHERLSQGPAYSPKQERDLFRIGVTVSKYYITKRLPQFSYECMEAMGGNGYVEDFPMARLFRQSPLNAIWEGSGNVIALDILRAQNSLPTLFRDIQHYKGLDAHLDSFVLKLEEDVEKVRADPLSSSSQRVARNIADRLGIALTSSVMLRFGNEKIAEAYIASRVRGRFMDSETLGVNYGGVKEFSANLSQHIIDRSIPILTNQ